MSDLFGNHIVGFPTRWLKLVQRQVVIIVVPPHGKTNNLHRRKQRRRSASPLLSKSKISSLLPSSVTEGLDGGSWYSLITKNLAIYSLSLKFWLIH